MSVLDVPGATLNYQVVGSGPLLVLIPGANGEHGIYQNLAHALADKYTVLTYDRRGFSESFLTDAQDYAHRLQTDADDVQRLIAHLSTEPAIVFGSSSGAIVALQVLVRHPDAVRLLLAHEPPVVKMLPDGEQRVSGMNVIYDIYRTSGIIAARQVFSEKIIGAADRAAMSVAPDARRGPFTMANATYWFERECREYPIADLDLDTLATHADKLVVLGGRASAGDMANRTARALAEKLGLEMVDVPGGHVGYVSASTEFAPELAAILTNKLGAQAPQ